MIEENEFEVYENSPIVLAIIQFRYRKIEEFNSAEIIKLGGQIKKDFPKSNVSILRTLKLNHAGETKVSIGNNEVNGVRFDSADNNKVLTIETEKFTYEVHGKYPGWKAIKNEVEKLWELFNGALNGLQLIGLSMRYTNRINLPLETDNLTKYFTTFLNSNTGNHLINQFQLRYTSVLEANLIIHVGHALEQAIGDSIPYFFDIDVINMIEIPNEKSAIWDIFSKLRSKKNSVFNDGITEETKKLIR